MSNFPNKWVALLIRAIIYPFGAYRKAPSDRLGQQVAQLLLEPSATRTRLITGAFLSPVESNPVGQLEASLSEIIAVEPLEKQLKQAQKEGKIAGLSYQEVISAGVSAGVITEAEAEQIRAAEQARQAIIAVDDFDPGELTHGSAVGAADVPMDKIA